MRAKVVEISWHETQPVYSADFQPLPANQIRKILNIPTANPASVPIPSTPTLSHAAPTAIPSSSPSSSSNTLAINTNTDINAEAGPSTSSSSQSASSPSPLPSGAGIGVPLTSSISSSSGGVGAGVGDIGTPGRAGGTASGSGATPSGGGGGVSSVGMVGNRQYRLATAGADGNVRIWMIYPNVITTSTTSTTLPGMEIAPHPPRAVYLSTLPRHMGSVNVVRWSPSGQTLASAGDDGNLILWVQSDTAITHFGDDRPDEFADKEHWRVQRSINVTTQQIYDIAWSPDGKYIIAGSTDNLAQVFAVADGATVHQIQNHSHYVQGVAWDPLNEYLATQSSDRSVQVHSVSTRNNTLNIHPTARENKSKGVSHIAMEIRASRPPSFNSLRPSMQRRSSTTSDAGSAITLASELNAEAGSVAMGQSLSSNTIPSTPMSNMNPPSNRPSSRRSSFSSSAAGPGSPLLTASSSFRNGRSPSPAPLPAIRPAPLAAQSINQKLYGDELATNFFRRLTFSPDGGLLLTPAGQIDDVVFPPLPSSSEDEGSSGSTIPKPRGGASADTKSTVYIYSRANLSKPPIAHLPGHKTTTVAVRFSPIFYDLRPISSIQSPPKDIILDKSNPNPVSVSIAGSAAASVPSDVGEGSSATPPSLFALPYRLMYAVAAQDAVMLYDTQQAGPIAIFKGLHYSAFTDIAWSPTGDTLLLSSSDGYCSIVIFDSAELGTVHATQQHQRQLQAIVQSHSLSHQPSSGNISHPPSPAISHSHPIPLPSRMDRESSVSSLSTNATGHHGGGGGNREMIPSPSPMPASTSAALSTLIGGGGGGGGGGEMAAPSPRASHAMPEIYGFPVGDAPTIQPSIASSSARSTPTPTPVLGEREMMVTDSNDGKRKAEDEGEQDEAKKRKMEGEEL